MEFVGDPGSRGLVHNAEGTVVGTILIRGSVGHEHGSLTRIDRGASAAKGFGYPSPEIDDCGNRGATDFEFVGTVSDIKGDEGPG